MLVYLEDQDFLITAENVQTLVSELVSEPEIMNSQIETRKLFKRKNFDISFDDDSGDLFYLIQDTSSYFIAEINTLDFFKMIAKYVRDESYLDWDHGDQRYERWWFVGGKILSSPGKCNITYDRNEAMEK